MIARRAVLALALCATFAAPSAFAQTYPSKPIRLIVPYPAARHGLLRAPRRHQDGRAAQPAGHHREQAWRRDQSWRRLRRQGAARRLHILLGDVATFAANQSLYKRIPFDFEKDFAPISLTARFVTVLLVNPNKLKANSVADVIAAAKAEPGKIDIAHAGVGNPFHLASVLFQQAAGIKLNEIPYRGAAPAIQDLVCRRRAADVRRLCDRALAHRGRHAQGARRCGSDRTCRIAGVPPVAATRARRLESLAVAGVRCAGKDARGDHLQAARYLCGGRQRSGGAQKLIDAGAEPLQSTPQEFADYRRREAAKWSEVVRRRASCWINQLPHIRVR